MNSLEANSNGCEEAFRQFLAHRTMLKSYVSAIVRDSHLAEDTLQDVAIQIARSWAAFDTSKDFGAWARGVARRVALRNIQKEKRVPALLDEETLERIGGLIEAMGNEGDMDDRKEALRRCMESLSDGNRRMVQMRYFEGKTYAEIGAVLKRTFTALYAAFSRVHMVLGKCIEGRMTKS